MKSFILIMLLIIVIMFSVMLCYGDEDSEVTITETTVFTLDSEYYNVNDTYNDIIYDNSIRPIDSNSTNTTNEEICYNDDISTEEYIAIEKKAYDSNEEYNNLWYTDYDIEDYSEYEFIPKDISHFNLTEDYILGTIPLLNRKVHRGNRASVYEFPFVVSIRRNLAHYQIGVVITPNVVITVAHAVYNVPIYDLTLVEGENYSDRGTDLAPIILCIVHQDFNPYTLQADLAILRTNIDMIFKGKLKEVMILRSDIMIMETEGTVVGWGRCDHTGKEICLPRSTAFYPNEISDPMLRSVRIQIDRTPFCRIYTDLMNLTLYPGMLCTGTSRLEQHMAPCMAVPGAPLIIYSYLVGLQSWGYGCGYRQDLPIIYTDIRFYISWLEHELQVLLNITSEDLNTLFIGSQSYVMARTLRSVRGLEPLTNDGSQKLVLNEFDQTIAKLHGTAYDYRDFIFDGVYSDQKHKAYDLWREQELNKLIMLSNMPLTDCAKPFLRDEERHYMNEDAEDNDSEQYDVNNED